MGQNFSLAFLAHVLDGVGEVDFTVFRVSIFLQRGEEVARDLGLSHNSLVGRAAEDADDVALILRLSNCFPSVLAVTVAPASNLQAVWDRLSTAVEDGRDVGVSVCGKDSQLYLERKTD